MIKIRRVKYSDLEDLIDLFEEFGEGKADCEEMVKIFSKYYTNPDYIYLCAELNGDIVGNLTGIVCNSLFTKYSPFMVLENVIVSKEYRRLGVGGLLLKEAEGFAKSKGCCEIMFVSSIDRKDAHKFYESFDYSLDVVQGFRKQLK